MIINLIVYILIEARCYLFINIPLKILKLEKFLKIYLQKFGVISAAKTWLGAIFLLKASLAKDSGHKSLRQSVCKMPVSGRESNQSS